MSRQKGTPKTGGRKKGTPNKKTKLLQEIIAASGVTPLDYMLGVLRDENATATERMDAAKAAAPSVHARLAAIDHAGNEEKPIQQRMIVHGVEETAQIILRAIGVQPMVLPPTDRPQGDEEAPSTE
jgi:hypothetical protein